MVKFEVTSVYPFLYEISSEDLPNFIRESWSEKDIRKFIFDIYGEVKAGKTYELKLWQVLALR